MQTFLSALLPIRHTRPMGQPNNFESAIVNACIKGKLSMIIYLIEKKGEDINQNVTIDMLRSIVDQRNVISELD